MRDALAHFYAYVGKNQERSLNQFKTIQFYQPDDFLILDPATQKNLELVRNTSGSTKNTLFSLLDNAVTPMGSRTVKKWIMRPLVEQQAIEQRHDAVAFLYAQSPIAQVIRTELAQLGDIERIIGRIMLGRAVLHDYLIVRDALAHLPVVHNALTRYEIPWLLKLVLVHMPDFSVLHHELTRALNDDTTKEWNIKAGYDTELDRLRTIVDSAHHNILALEQHEQQATGIGSLKIKYSGTFGYAIEITKAHYGAVPSHYIRQQTLVGRERFITPELQKLQYELVHARTLIEAAEKEVFARVHAGVVEHGASLRKLAQALAHLDALVGFATLACDNNYVRPTFNKQRNIYITQGRHPVVEQVVQHHFIANDTALTDQESLWIITGPNMGGKSTYLRQVALISIMAQCGSFVSAQQANLSILDRIFTRIGAGDNVADGKSTFLVEMEETAIICTQATERSLVILDEVGRGTSTFDGIAIAQAVIEYIFTTIKARCFFATHYHELTTLSAHNPGIACYHAASTRTKDGIVFLHKIVRGTADGSFGLEVAKLAALPHAVIQRAYIILQSLHASEGVPYQPVLAAKNEERSSEHIQNLQRTIADLETKLTRLHAVDWENITPKKALDVLWELKNL